MTFDASGGDILADEGFYLAVLLGLCLGSLATALAYRLPRGISMIAQERSQCPSCNRTLGFADLVPVFSWLFLRGRCRGCKKPYGLRYLGIECATLAACLAVYFIWPAGAPALAAYLAMPALVAMVAIDFEWQILPDKLNAWLAVMALLAIMLVSGIFPLDARPADIDMAVRLAGLSLAGGLMYGGFSYALRAAMRWRMGQEPMGLGDVKFFAAAGLWLGPDLLRFSLFMLAAGVAGLVLGLVWQRIKGTREFPFGPALIVAFIGFLLAGQALLMPDAPEYVNFF